MREPLSRPAQKEWITKTCALAAQTFMLAASSLGLDTCPMEGFDSKRVRAILGIPKDGWVVMLIAVGHRSEDGTYGERYRVPRDAVVRRL